MKPPDPTNGCDQDVIVVEDVDKSRNVGSRPDRAAKLLARKEVMETVVKSSLLKYVKGDDVFKEKFTLACRQRVDAFSKRIVMASIRMSGLLKHAFDGHLDVRQVSVPDIFDQTLVRQLMLGIDDAVKPHPDVVAYLQLRPDGLEQRVGERFEGDRNIYSSGASKYITNLKNALKSTFRQRLLTFLKRVVQPELQMSNEQRSVLLYRIAGWKIPNGLEDIDVSSKQLQAVIDEQRSILGLSKTARTDDKWFDRKNNLVNVLRQWVFFNRAYEMRSLPLFAIVPACKIRHHFITIDTSSFFGILKEIGAIRKCSFEVFDSMRKDQWYSVFDLKRFEDDAGVRKFSFTIETDAVSLCSHWHQPKRMSSHVSELPPLDPRTSRVIAIDPGRVIIYYAVEKMKDGRFKSYTLTRRQYYALSGVFNARKQTERWQEEIHEALVMFASVSIKGVSVEQHQAFLNAYDNAGPALWAEYTKSRWARQRLRLYGGKKRAFATFFESIKDADDQPELRRPVVVAYGSANVGTGGKGELSAPSTRALKECQSRFDCRKVDEFRSSKVHWSSGEILKLISVVEQKNNKREGGVLQRSKTLRGLLWYDSTIDRRQSKFVGRDFNAAINIWRCATNASRPDTLMRRSGDRPIVQSVGKVINRRMEPVRWR